MGKPILVKLGVLPAEYIGGYERTQGSEPSQYLEEEKTNSDSDSSGERNRNSLNRREQSRCGVVGPHK